jgi:RNA polymerase sigma-70 factor, ECF subfamily
LKALEYETDERQLIEAAQQDPSRFAELYEHNFHRVYAYVLHRVHDRDLAEDLTAEVFHQALANIGRFEWRGAPFAAWLVRIAANAIADRFQSAAVRHESATDTLDETPSQGHGARADENEIERRAMLFKLVDSLPEDQRLVIVRRFVDQRSIRDIAEELGRSEGAIKQLQFRALQTLRTKTRTHHG